VLKKERKINLKKTKKLKNEGKNKKKINEKKGKKRKYRGKNV